MIYSQVYYERAGINIFHYATLFDYLIMPFKDKIILILGILSGLLLYVVFKISHILTLRKKQKKTGVNISSSQKLGKWILGALAVIYLFYSRIQVVNATLFSSVNIPKLDKNSKGLK